MRVVNRNLRGYESRIPFLYAEPGKKWQLALPAFFAGEVDTGRHTSPIPNINELIP